MAEALRSRFCILISPDSMMSTHHGPPLSQSPPPVWILIFDAIRHDPAFLEEVAHALFPASRTLVEKRLRELYDSHVSCVRSSNDVFSDFIMYVTQFGDTLPDTVREAVGRFRAACDKRKRIRKDIIHKCRLNHTGDSLSERTARRMFLATCKEVVVSDHSQSPYPPAGLWVAESASDRKQWEHWCLHHRLKDDRQGHHDMHVLEPDRLQYVAEAHESVLFYNTAGHLVAFVIRDFCSDPTVVKTIADDVRNGCLSKKSVRVRPAESHILVEYGALNLP